MNTQGTVWHINRKSNVANRIILILLVASFGLVYARPAWADAAPPWQPPGSSIDPGGFATHVQMMSEEVLLVIDAEEPTTDRRWGYGGGGKVEARFVMRNQGEREESFDVLFPLGVSSTFDIETVKNFGAWVDGVPAPVSEVQREDPRRKVLVPWATWPVTFPPGQDVVLRVTYDVVSVEWEPFFIYYYILETGAGWWGPIGEGTITFRLPYEMGQLNTVLYDHPLGESYATCGNPGDLVIAGTDVMWRFSDLEPTPEDNFCLTILRPALWQGILAAQEEVATTPDSPGAYLRLARLQEAALPRMGGIFAGVVSTGNSPMWAELALASYERALELAPEDVEIYVEYLELLGSVLWSDLETPARRDAFVSTLEQAQQLAPDDERLHSIAERALQMESILQVPMVTPTSMPPQTPTATFVPSPIVPIAAPSTALTSKPEVQENFWPGLLLIALTPLGALGMWVVRRQGGRYSS
jgi:hypothetical protein